MLAAASALMGSYFGIMDHVVGWMQVNGLPQESARTYLAQHFLSLSMVSIHNAATSLEDLCHEYSAKGRLNEQLFAEFREGGGLDALVRALDVILARVQAN